LAASPQRKHSNPEIDLHGLSLELAQLDLADSRKLGARLVKLIADNLSTNRVSLVLLTPGTTEVSKIISTGFKLKQAEIGKSSLVINEVLSGKSPLLLYDIRQRPELVSPWSENYLTDAAAIFPLVFDHSIQAVICISNLSRQHLVHLENSADQLNLIVTQLTQICRQLIRCPEETGRRATDTDATDELALLNSFIEKLDQSMDARNVFTIFNDLVSDYVPYDLMAVMHDSLAETQQSAVCVQRPSHMEDLRGIFDSLCMQWQRRHRHAPQLTLEQATMFGENLVKRDGRCPAEMKLGRVETFPIFIDNDLFALIVISAKDEILADRRRMRLFNILSHHLLLHIKKGILQMQNQEMQTVDSLTGLYNERHFYQMVEREFDRASRYNVPLGMLVIDVDHFKDVNETYGYETGDMLLQEISRILMENMRTTDIVSRYSGERFVVVLPETHYKNSEIMANRLRRFIENNSFFIPNTNVFIKVTVSIGVASYLDHNPTSLAQFIEFADTALYFAKRNGRNQVVGYSYVINLMMRDTESEG